MAVKVTLKNFEVESFEHEDAHYFERSRDGFLEVKPGDGTTKVFAKDYWIAVEGKQKPYEVGFA